MSKKLVFWDQEKGPFFSNFDYFAKTPDFVRLWWPHQLTYNNPQGISRKTMSISFIWYQLFWIGALDEAYVASWKSGLNFNALDLVISVLGNKAVLDWRQFLVLIISSRVLTWLKGFRGVLHVLQVLLWDRLRWFLDSFPPPLRRQGPQHLRTRLEPNLPLPRV